ncbi:MAG: hypothetical protein HC916_07600 [Coleofasciculaceae cyanobacterium SM2_1_6]|nr:hypothetical protein [Coleofasciculaceae cyanobacterium SM2_1_6]
MENLLLISEAAQELEQHGNSARIKKLIFATWKNCWENDLSLINRFPLTNILQELVDKAPTPEQLRAALFNIVNTLNKKDEYAVVAEIILTKLATLYPTEEPKTEMVYRAMPAPAVYPQPAPVSMVTPKESGIDTITNIKAPTNEEQSLEDSSPQHGVIVDSPVNQNNDHFIENQSVEHYQEHQSSPVAGVQHNLQGNIRYDPFMVRLEIMKYSNPLRAKMLLLCIVEEQVIFNQGSWLKLRSRNLDELLAEAFQKFSSLERLESQLQVIANNLQEPDENMQSVEAIVKAIKPFYPA